eukprot:scaffold7878_cov126-Isochrysis_galbana.AAC.7
MEPTAESPPLTNRASSACKASALARGVCMRMGSAGSGSRPNLGTATWLTMISVRSGPPGRAWGAGGMEGCHARDIAPR